MESNYAGSDWIAKSFPNMQMSEFGKQVADLLGDVFQGIYHLNATSLAKAHWFGEDYLELNHYGGMATWDFDQLTRLVVLCHDRCIRMELKGTGPGYMKMCFAQRKREGGIWDRHPKMEEAVKTIRDAYSDRLPADATIKEIEEQC